ncbi:hypothetical protein Esti_003383 [Eimeria stiedai]
MKASSKKVTRPTTTSSRDTSRSTTSPTSRSASEASSLRGRPVLCGPHASDSSVVLGILQNIAKQTVEQAIVQHHQRGGKAVSGARVRITPGGLLCIGQEEAGETAIPQVVQEFTVSPSQDENGNEVRAVSPAAQLVDPNFRAAYETSPSASRLPPMNDNNIYALNTIDHRASNCHESLGGAFRLPPHMAAAHAYVHTPSTPPLSRPRSTCCFKGRTCRSSSDLQERSSASTSTAACCRIRPTCGSAWTPSSCASCGRLPAVPPSCCEDHVPAAPTPLGIDTSSFAEQLMQSFSGGAKLKNLPPDIKGLVKNILKLWATKACYEDAARAVKAWMTRRRCSYSEEATEELALREIPQQYEKYRNLGRATAKLQRQLEAQLSSTILHPLHHLPTTELEASSSSAFHLFQSQQPATNSQLSTKMRSKTTQGRMPLAKRLKGYAGPSAPDTSCRVTSLLEPHFSKGLPDLHDAFCLCGWRDLTQARSQELCEERDHLSARLVAQQEMLRQLSEVNQRQIAELVRLKGRHRALCRITPGVESLRRSSTSADVPNVFVKPRGISAILMKTQPAVRQQAKSTTFSPHSKTRMFEFDHVYDDKTTTHDIYMELKDLTASALAGNILGFVVLGPPKSGKTSTLFFSPQSSATEGAARGPQEEGLVVHCLRHLFDLLREKCLLGTREGSTDVTLQCTCVEVHNEILLDAFDMHSRVNRTKPEVVKNARTGTVRVTNLRVLGGKITGDSPEELVGQNPFLDNIVEELRAALERRHEASRNSHVVFTVSVEPRPRECNNGNALDESRSRRSARGAALCGEVFRESKLTRIMEECFQPPALSVLLLTIRNDSLRLNLAQFYADVCALARR